MAEGRRRTSFLGNLLVGAECLWVVDGDSDGRAAEYSAIDRRRNGSSPTHSPNSHTLLLGGWCGGKGRDRGRDREKREGWEEGEKEREGQRGVEREKERELLCADSVLEFCCRSHVLNAHDVTDY